jgi:hypothetical protein
MSTQGPIPEKIQNLLNSLPLQMRQALQEAIEKAREQGKEDAIYATLSQQFKLSLNEPEFCLPEPSRLFFKPIEKFLIDDCPPQKIIGRIWRGSLQQLWSWIEHHAAAEDVSQCRLKLQELSGKVSSENDSTLLLIGNSLQKNILPKLEDELNRGLQTPDTRRRFAHQLGGDYQMLELEDIAILLKYKDFIESYSKNLPNALSHTSESDVLNITKIFTKFSEIEPRLPYYASVLLQKKLEQAAYLPSWASACARSDDLRIISHSPFAAFIDITLGDAAALAEQCINNLTKPPEQNQTTVYVRQYALLCRNLRAAIDLESQTSDWLRRLSEIRLRVTNALSQELGEIFQLMRRNVRPLRAFGKEQPFPPDTFDLERLCFLISILYAIRSNGQEFALNELVTKLYGECDGYLQLAIDSLQEELRTNFSDKRRIILSYAEAAVRVSKAWHGEEHAAVLKRSFDTAAATINSKATA